MLGPPGAGKGTQAKLLADRHGVPHISTGDIFRAAIGEGTPLGRRAKSYLDSGALVPDEIVIGIVVERLDAPDCGDGFILDGFPRTVAQADALDRHLSARGKQLTAAVNLEVDADLILKRLTGRRVCRACGEPYHVETKKPPAGGVCGRCGGEIHQRDDDRPETVARRLEVYTAQTEPLLAYYGRLGLLLTVRANGTIAEVDDLLEKALAAWRAR